MSKIPKIARPIFTLTLPSSGEEIQYMPYTVKEKTVLLMAAETEDIKTVLDAIKQIIRNCVVTETFDVDSAPQFDLEYIFLKMHCASDSNESEVTFQNNKCEPKEGMPKCPETASLKINLSDVEISILDDDMKTYVPFDAKKYQYRKEGKQIILSEEGVGVVVRFPTINDIKSIDIEKTPMQMQDQLILTCIQGIFDKDSVIYRNEFSEEDLKEFFESLPSKSKKKLDDFINRVPVLKKTVTYCCENCKYTEDITLIGLKDFFG